ncbi:pilus assembly protein PilP [Luminiphilus sp.]|nr:pilus assembly protein PilP [Luminiphilus sp.]
MAAVLSACADRSFNDLDDFMDEKRALPGGVVQSIPTFEPYEAFVYAAATLRSPFDRPMNARQLAALSAPTMVHPDEDRTKDYLERFSLDTLAMVGTLQRDSANWSLIKDPEGRIHRIQLGSFLGRDHGRVVEMGDAFVAVTEIVSDGTENGWVERPRTIELTGM